MYFLKISAFLVIFTARLSITGEFCQICAVHHEFFNWFSKT